MTLVTQSKKTRKKTDSEKKHENGVTRDCDFFSVSKYLVTRDFLIKSQSHNKKSQSLEFAPNFPKLSQILSNFLKFYQIFPYFLKFSQIYGFSE